MDEQTLAVLGISFGTIIVCFLLSGLWFDFFEWFSNWRFDKKHNAEMSSQKSTMR